jgi:hypothetical protein
MGGPVSKNFDALFVEPKDPDEAKFYSVRLSNRLNSGATPSSATWTCPGLTFANTSVSSTHAIAKISGGQDGQDYVVVVTVTTSDGETLKPRRLLLSVRRSDTPRSA